jgi:hypothetical protein
MAPKKRKVSTVAGLAQSIHSGPLHYYNHKRGHRSLGGDIPDDVFHEDPAPLDMLDPSFVARALMRRAHDVVVQKDGIEFLKVKYFHAALFNLIGETVSIGWLEQRPDYIEVFAPDRADSEGAWICRAMPIESASPGMGGRVYQTREHNIQAVEDVHAAAKQISEAKVDAVDDRPGTGVRSETGKPRPAAGTGKSARDKANRRLAQLHDDGVFE